VKIGNVKRNTPASRAGLHKMDYLISVNQVEIFKTNFTQLLKTV